MWSSSTPLRVVTGHVRYPKDGIMNKVVCILSLVLLVGCARSPVVRSTISNGKGGFHAYLNKKPYFSLITDGDVNGGVTVYAHVSATFKGAIGNSNDTESIPFNASGSTITIGKQEYDLDNGRVVLVSTHSLPFKVNQFKVSEEDKINALLASDKRMVDFFK